jgi:hypothetical protein
MEDFYLLVQGLFNDAVSILYYTASNNRQVVKKKELERVWKESAVPETEIGSKLVNVLWGTEELHEKMQSRSQIPRPIFVKRDLSSTNKGYYPCYSNIRYGGFPHMC